MKWFVAVAALALSTMVAIPGMAQDGNKGGKGQRGQRGGARSEDFRKQLLEKFDKDGDGKLSDEERAEARKEFEKTRGQRGGAEGRRRGPGGPGGGPGGFNREELIKQFDKDGDGKLSEEEQKAARAQLEERRKETLKKFDKDGDGKLNDEERAAMRESLRANRPEGKKKAE